MHFLLQVAFGADKDAALCTRSRAESRGLENSKGIRPRTASKAWAWGDFSFYFTGPESRRPSPSSTDADVGNTIEKRKRKVRRLFLIGRVAVWSIQAEPTSMSSKTLFDSCRKESETSPDFRDLLGFRLLPPETFRKTWRKEERLARD